MRFLLGVGTVLLALALPAQAQLGIQNPTGPAPVTLYMHLLDFQDFPINTQKPVDIWEGGPGAGLMTHTLTCAPNPPMSNVFQENHQYRGYSSASYVEYDFMMDGKPRTHPERGLGADILLNGNVPPVLHWYLETNNGPSPFPFQAPLVVPGVVVQATLRAPDSISVDDAAYNTGRVIAQGRSAPATLAADATQGAEHSMVGERHVYGITVPLVVEQAILPKNVGYTLSVDVFVDNPACADPERGTVMPNQVAPFTDPAHRPRIEAVVSPQLAIDKLEPVFAPNRTVEIHANLTAAWGAYDLDEGNVTLGVEGPDGPVEATLASFVQRTREWNHVTDPVRAMWVVDMDGLSPGLYRVTLDARNDQHTAVAHATAAFRIGPDVAYPVRAGQPVPDLGRGGQEMPAVSAVALAGVLATVALLASRRRRN